jgi:hypothetical protein
MGTARLQEPVQIGDDGRAQFLPHGAAVVGRASADIFLDRIELRDADERFGCHRARRSHLVEAASDMRPAISELDLVRSTERVIASIAVDLQHARKAREMLGWATVTPPAVISFIATSLDSQLNSVVAFTTSGSKNTLSRCPRDRQQLSSSALDRGCVKRARGEDGRRALERPGMKLLKAQAPIRCGSPQ